MIRRRYSWLALVLVACGGGGGAMPDAAQPGDAGGSGSGWPAVSAIPLVGLNGGAAYAAHVSIGGQSFLMGLGTADTAIGVAGSACTTCGVSPLYTPGATAMDQHGSDSSEFGDGSKWSGEIFSDRVSLGNGTPPTTLTFVDITSQTSFFATTGDQYQGIFGLGPAVLAGSGVSTFLTTAAQDGLTPTFALELCGSAGTLWLGGFDQAKAASAPQFTPMLPASPTNPFYSIGIEGMAIGSAAVGSGTAAFGTQVVDVGTTTFYAPTPVVTATLAAVNASAGFQALFPAQPLAGAFPCVTTAGVTAAMVDAQLPPLALTLPSAGGSDFTLAVPPSHSYLVDSGSGEFCFAIGDGGTGAQAFTEFGITIMRAFVTIVDVEHAQVGFAVDTGCP